MTNKTLLPIGFEDWGIAQAERAHDLLARLIDCFQSYHYRLVAPPVIEFEESLTAGKESLQAPEIFRLIDPISRHSVALRGDMTPQISRLAKDHLQEEARPLRLCYYGHVFRIAGSTMRPQRQYMQLGIEHIGQSCMNADTTQANNVLLQRNLEILQILLESLQTVGIEKLCLDFALPVLLRDVVNTLPESTYQLLAARNLGGLRNQVEEGVISQKISDLLKFLLTLPPDVTLALQELRKNPSFAAHVTLLGRMEQLLERLQQSHPQVQFSLDVIEQQHFADKTGIAFTIYARDLNAVIGRGGEYRAHHEEAAGVSVYMDSVLALAPAMHKSQKILYVGYNTDFNLTRTWRQQGWTVQFIAQPKQVKGYYWDGMNIKNNK